MPRARCRCRSTNAGWAIGGARSSLRSGSTRGPCIAPGSLGNRVGRGEDACHGGEQPEPARGDRGLPVAAQMVGGQEDGRGAAVAPRGAARDTVAGTWGRGAPAGGLARRLPGGWQGGAEGPAAEPVRRGSGVGAGGGGGGG